jgi:COP9 signalosome complex subunit 1
VSLLLTSRNPVGRTRFERLLFIGLHSAVLCIDSLKAAVVEAKKGSDCERYKFAQGKLAIAAPQEPEAVFDAEWLEQKEKENKKRAMRLEGELKGYKNNLIKESIRACLG